MKVYERRDLVALQAAADTLDECFARVDGGHVVKLDGAYALEKAAGVVDAYGRTLALPDHSVDDARMLVDIADRLASLQHVVKAVTELDPPSPDLPSLVARLARIDADLRRGLAASFVSGRIPAPDVDVWAREA